MTSRLVFVTNDETHGGPNKVCERVSNLFSTDSNCELIIQGKGELGFTNLSVKNFTRLSESNFKFFFEFISKESKKFKNTTYIVFGTKQSLFLCLIKFLFRKKIKIIIRTGLNGNGSKHKKGNVFKDYFQLSVCKNLYRLADMLVTETSSMRDWWIEQNVNSKNVVHINNPVKKLELKDKDLDFYKNLTKGYSKVIVSIGRLSYQKDHDLLVRAFSECVKLSGNKSYVLIILGEGNELDSLKKLCKELSIENQVKFLGHVDNVRPFLELSDLYCLTSRWEGGVNSLIEAVYYGSKILAIDCPVGPADILSETSDSVLVKSRSPKIFSEAMVQMLEQDLETSHALRNVDAYYDDNIKLKYKKIIEKVGS